MNDRPSRQPPKDYMGKEDELTEEYDGLNRTSAASRFTYDSDASVLESAANTDSSRRFGLFRFGKSMASSFNPSNWKIFAKSSRQQPEHSQQKLLDERTVEAQQKFMELKNSDYFRRTAIGGPGSVTRGDSSMSPRDSGIGFANRGSWSESKTSVAEKRMGRVFMPVPTASNEGVHAAEAASRSHSAQSFHRKMAGETSSARQSVELDPYMPTPEHQVRRMPSRKEIAHQQKLVKRVSDLESKLDVARRQLSDALGEPEEPGTRSYLPPSYPPPAPPYFGRPRFVPGALATLPSESLLSGYLAPDEDDEVAREMYVCRSLEVHC